MPVTAVSLRERKLKRKNELAAGNAASRAANKLVVLTAYDYPTAQILDEVGVDVVLVGDSAAMVVMADAYGADARLVAIMQYLRVLCVAISATLVPAARIDERVVVS